MMNMKNHTWFRAIAIVLIAAFLSLDIAWADPSRDKLSTRKVSQEQLPNNGQPIESSEQAIVTDYFISNEVLEIANYLFGNEEKGIGPQDFKYLKSTLSEELKKAGSVLDLGLVRFDGNVISIPYERNGKRWKISIALKDSVYAEKLEGKELAISKRYTIKILRTFPEEPIAAPEAVTAPAPSEITSAKSIVITETPKPSTPESQKPQTGTTGSTRLLGVDPVTTGAASMSILSSFGSYYIIIGIVVLIGGIIVYRKLTAFSRLSKKLLEGEGEDKGDAIKPLVKMGPKAIPVFAKALETVKEKFVRGWIVKEIISIKDPRVADLLIKATKDKESEVRKDAMESLAAIKDERLLDIFVRSLGEPSIASEAADILLNKMDDPNAISRVIVALSDTDPKKRELAARILAKSNLKDRRAAGPFLKLLDDDNEDIRRWARTAIIKLHDTSVVERLRKELLGNDAQKRHDAASFLEGLGWKPANIHEEVVYNICNRNREKLIALGASAVPELTNILNDARWSQYHALVIDILAKIGSQNIADSLIKALGSTEYKVAESAATTLGDLKDAGAVGSLLKKIKEYNEPASEKNGDLHRIVMQAVEKIVKNKEKDPDAVRPLVTVLRDFDADPGFRRDVAKILKNIWWQPATKEEEISFAICLNTDSSLKELVKIGSPSGRLAQGARYSRS